MEIELVWHGVYRVGKTISTLQLYVVEIMFYTQNPLHPVSMEQITITITYYRNE